MLKQQTLKGSFTLNGKGLHTGVKLTHSILPQNITGIRFSALIWMTSLLSMP